MYRLSAIIALLLFEIVGSPYTAQAQQEDFNLALTANAQIDFPDTIPSQYKSYNDVWGWVHPDGTEYAIMGSGIGTSIFSLEDPSEPKLLITVPGALSNWRDMKSFQSYIYTVADEGRDGLLVIDMSAAPDSVTWSFWKPDLNIAGQSFKLFQCHNLYIDSTYAYLAGCDGPGGVYIFDLAADPISPPFVSASDPIYAHDVYVKNDKLYASNLSQGFSIVDISDITNPRTIAVQATTRNFTHNAWASDDGQFLFTTDERSGAYVDAYDVSNPDEILRLDIYRPLATEDLGVIPHNVHYYQGYLVTSYYTDGIKIIDAHQPDNLVEVASYDTYFFRDGTFGGVWGAYPYLPSGLVLASDRSTGLYVLQPTYQRAAYLEGIVRDSSDNSLLQGVSVEFESERPGSTSSDDQGRYSTGLADDGQQRVSFFKFGYHRKTIDIALQSDSTVMLEVALKPLQTFVVSGTVLDESTNGPIANAPILVQNGIYREDALSAEDGTFTVAVFEGQSIVAAGKWGYVHGFADIDLDQSISDVVIRLSNGYRDDFMFDYGWQVDNGSQGSLFQGWDRGEPGYAIYDAAFANPNGDIENDFGNLCYATGLAGNLSANISDSSILSSPIFDLSGYTDPFLHYFVWFYANGVNPPDDKLDIYLSNGNEEVLIESISDSRSEWRERSSIRIADFLVPTAQMSLRLLAEDEGNVHIYEAGLDGFAISEGLTTAYENKSTSTIKIFPNPFTHTLSVESTDTQVDRFYITDLLGRQLLRGPVTAGSTLDQLQVLRPGTYFLTLMKDRQVVGNLKVVKME
ncbi:MAG: choice-of-anchor B family protein [Saprospiraceae bacterium]|nr:choice-of-anchor B family protein [Saprospiraceae bacterium]